MTKSEFIQNAAIQYAMKGVDPAAAWQKAADLAGAAPQNVAWEANTSKPPSSASKSSKKSSGSVPMPTNFPNYGRGKNGPIRDASAEDLDYYANGARKTLADAGKAHFHDRERALLEAIDAEIQRQESTAAADFAPAAAPSDDDIPF